MTRGRGKIDAPETRARLDKFQCDGDPVFVDADNATLQVLLRLKIGQQDSLFREHARINGHQSAVSAHVDRLGTFGKRFVLHRAVQEDWRMQIDAMSPPSSEAEVAWRFPPLAAEAPAEKMPR